MNREAECVMSPSTLFRGSSLAAKIIGYCLRVFGHAYLYETLSPLFQFMLKKPDKVYEIEQDRFELISFLFVAKCVHLQAFW